MKKVTGFGLAQKLRHESKKKNTKKMFTKFKSYVCSLKFHKIGPQFFIFKSGMTPLILYDLNPMGIRFRKGPYFDETGFPFESCTYTLMY